MTDLVCELCGKPFDRPQSVGRIPKYCSNSHRQEAYVQRRIRRGIESANRRENARSG